MVDYTELRKELYEKFHDAYHKLYVSELQEEIEKLRKEVKEVDDDWNMLRDKYDMLVIENMDLKKRIAHLEKTASDASWTAEMYRNQIDDRPKW